MDMFLLHEVAEDPGWPGPCMTQVVEPWVCFVARTSLTCDGLMPHGQGHVAVSTCIHFFLLTSGVFCSTSVSEAFL